MLLYLDTFKVIMGFHYDFLLWAFNMGFYHHHNDFLMDFN